MITADTTATLSLCMIVKNEEKYLPQCLESVKNIVDEIIIVDTGSTDKTVEIAKSYNAKVYHHAWEGSFSKARNTSLSYATCDWILVIDADEELDKDDAAMIKPLLNSANYNVIFCAVLSKSPSGDSKNYSHRIFKNNHAHYEGIVHNQLVHDGSWLHTNIRIYHYGYNLSPVEMKAKYKRTQELLQKQLEDDPTNPFAYQNFIRVLRVQKLDKEAVETGYKALRECSELMNDVHLQMISGDLAFSLLSLNKFSEAEKISMNILSKFPTNLDINFANALSLQGQGHYRAAINKFLYFINLNRKMKSFPQHTLVLIDTFDFEHRAWGNISDCYVALGEFSQSLDAIEKAIALNPHISVYRTAKARILVDLGQMETAKKSLELFEQQTEIDPVFYNKWVLLYLKYPQMGNSIDIIHKGLQRFPEDLELLNLLATVTFSFDINRAASIWDRILKMDNNHIGAHVGLASSNFQNKNKKLFLEHVNIVMNCITNIEILKQLGSYCISLELYAKAIELYTKYLELDHENIDILIDISTCYAKLGKFDAAFEGYKNALRVSPNNMRIINNLHTLQLLMQSK